MIPLAEIVDTGALARVVAYSLVAGVGITFVFSFAIVGVTRFDDIRRGARRGPAPLYLALAIVATLVVLAAVVEAIIIMTSK